MANDEKPVKVLHVTECFAGGVQTALEGYASADITVEHHIIYSARRHPQKLMKPRQELFNTVSVLPYSHFAATKAVMKKVRTARPDVLHAHSSFAGVYARVAGILTKTPVVYTPHGLAYQRKDISIVRRGVFQLIEKILAPFTAVLAGCASYETRLLRRLSSKPTTLVIPNALSDEREAVLRRIRKQDHKGPRKVTFIGRITAARDPEMAAKIAEFLIRAGLSVQWIGDGDPGFRDLLEHKGVHVTGWLQEEELAQALSEVDLVIHTSKWDGFPLTILEVIVTDLPLLVQRIEALEECPKFALFETAEEAALKALSILDGRESVDWSPITNFYNRVNQAEQLNKAYRSAHAKR
ncbi:glycosyltransferase [Corynebacterium auriscanis]|uniref:glycosyltransferase n=1 Tax=Corynebacterium auriscanis TaxID=99807 RepID=UPI003CF793DA